MLRLPHDHPGNTFVASLIGSPPITLMEGVRVQEGRAEMGREHTVDLGIPREQASRAQGSVIVGVRPEAWEIVGEGEAHRDDAVPLKVIMIEHLGSEAFLYCEAMMTEDSTVTIRGGRVVVRADKRHPVVVDQIIQARPRFGESYFFARRPRPTSSTSEASPRRVPVPPWGVG